MTTIDDIHDPVMGAEYCKERMKKCEMRAQIAEEKGDLVLVAKFEGHLFAWAELLQHYLRESYQEGKTSEELTTSLNKKPEKKPRYNAKPNRERADATGDSRSVGFESAPRGMGMEESIQLAKRGLVVKLEKIDNELFKAIGEVHYTSGKDASQGDNEAEQSDSDSG